MNCVLCLEPSVDSIAGVRFDSEAARNINIDSIIKKNLGELKIVGEERHAPCCICQLCWQTLQTFHEFCVRVERAHQLLESRAKTKASSMVVQLEAQEPSSQIKEEGDTVNVDNYKPKRKRGRPRHGAKTKASSMVVQLESQEPSSQIKQEGDTVNVDNCNPKRKRGRPRKGIFEENATTSPSTVRETRAAKRSSNENENKGAAKIEALFVPVVKAEYLENSDTVEGFDTLQEDATSDADEPKSKLNDSEVTLTQRGTDSKKRVDKYSQKTLISRQSDEYIANHLKLSCSVCAVALVDFAELKTHFRTEHQQLGYVLCCGKKLLKRGVLVDHLRTHEDPSYFKCNLCEKVMSTRRSLELHVRRHEDLRERKYECEFCKKKYYLQAVYMRHLLLHVPEEERTVLCPQCGKGFASEQLMTQHLRLVHLRTYSKICDICGKSVLGREALRRHLDEHSGVPRPLIQCDLCGVVLTSKSGLKFHMKTMHTEENRQPQVCPVCSKVSHGLRAHQYHIKYMHKMQRTHACLMCSKAFKRATDLKEHMSTHTGDVLYTCPHCPKTFNSNANMYSHRKKVHRKEWEAKRLEKYNKLPTVTTPSTDEPGLLLESISDK